MRVVTSETMRGLDARAMSEGGIPGAVLMENAGRAVFEHVAQRFGPVRGRLYRVLCGTGNNGGDGLVVARYLALAGARVAVHVAGDASRIRGDALLHRNLLHGCGVDVEQGLPAGPDDAVAVVDALLGTGVEGAPRGDVAAAIEWITARGLPVVAVDIPSGVSADTGRVPGGAVQADSTVTFAYPKLGMFLAPGADLVGEIVVRDIGFHWDSLGPSTPYRWIRAEDVAAVLPRRPREAHKGVFGHVLVVGGSTGMSGAPAMAARAALRAGAGLVTLAAPQSAQRLVAARLAEVMTVPLPEQDGALAEAGIDALQQAAERCDVLCVGPGATRRPGAQKLMLEALRAIARPAVVDADGLIAVAEGPGALVGRHAPTVITPHPGECARLLGVDAAAVEQDRVAAVRDVAARFGCVAVLKGARTLICDGRARDGDPPVAINTSGNPGMATGGSGDSLTGIIGALIGQGLDAFDAAWAGAHLHGRAGDVAARRVGLAGMVAGDIIDGLPQAIVELEGLR